MRGPFAALCAALCLMLAAPAASQQAPMFSVYPSYSAKFDLASEKFSLITSTVIYNISGKTLTDVTFRQVYPDGVTVKETYQRDVGTAATGEQSSQRKVEANSYFGSMPTYRTRQYVAIFNELQMARRLNEISFPGVEISYIDPEGEKHTSRLPDNTYDLFKYSNVVGGLQRFLRKYNNITFDFKQAVPTRTEWDFGPIVASAQGRFPTGIIGTFPEEDDQYNGYFRLRSGPPGNNIQLLVVYKGVDKKNRTSDREALMKEVRQYLRWCGEFDLAEGLQVEQGVWKKYKDAWSLEGLWRDTIPERFGEGPFLAKVFYGPHEDVEYYVIGLAHGRGFGPEASATPKPEQEAALLEQTRALIETFKSYIVPLSSDRRRGR